METRGRFPSWLHRRLPLGDQIFKTNTIIDKYRLNTVCEEAKCPNRLECYTKKTATFLIMIVIIMSVSIVPAVRASRIKPVDALRYV